MRPSSSPSLRHASVSAWKVGDMPSVVEIPVTRPVAGSNVRVVDTPLPYVSPVGLPHASAPA